MAKKLIEVALPLEAINKESAREKSIRHGHPSTLHLWWARRPLAAARAVVWASLVDDPSEHPEQFPSEEEQNSERQRLFAILEKLVDWDNVTDETVLSEAKKEILKSTNNNPPILLDPFAGGGAIPFEAQRLGLKVRAHDLNPVAVMINKAMVEIPSKFRGTAPVNPDIQRLATLSGWNNVSGLAEDTKYYGEKLKQKVFNKIGHMYPMAVLPKEYGGGTAPVVAWVWTRIAKCPNPACDCEIPLASRFVLSTKKGKEAWAEPIYEGRSVRFEVHRGKCPKGKESNKLGRSALFKCPKCGETTTDEYVKKYGIEHGFDNKLMAIIAEGKNERIYLTPTIEHMMAANVVKPEEVPSGAMPNNPRWFSPPAFGMKNYDQLFTNRQITILMTLGNLLEELQKEVEQDAIKAGMANDHIPLEQGGNGAFAYSEALKVYLSFAIDRCADYYSMFATWSGDFIAHTFGRQAIPMVWDFAECNPFSNSTGNWSGAVNWICSAMERFPINPELAEAKQHVAQEDCGFRNIMISTDPPYYDNIGYADLSDYFYIWMRRTVRSVYPSLFSTMMVPKAEELVATPYRFEGGATEAKKFFEDGMLETCKLLNVYADSDIPVTIYYAYRQSDTDANDNTSSNGWETMLNAIISAGFAITGTWPMRTERTVGIKGHTNMLASSIVLVCRKRPKNAAVCTRRNFIKELKRELKESLHKLQKSNIAPVDMAQSAIGPGMGVFSKYEKVLESDGSQMTVRSALQIINQELDLYFNEQDGELDRNSRFCIDVYSQYAFNDMKFGDADTLARAKNTSVSLMVSEGLISAQKGIVHLIERNEITDKSGNDSSTWLLCQQLTKAMETGGIEACAKMIVPMYGSAPEHAKDLAYRLYTIAERKGWAQEAYAYNALVVSWPEIQSRAAALQAIEPKQMTLFDFV